jgi:hypothetical protein
MPSHSKEWEAEIPAGTQRRKCPNCDGVHFEVYRRLSDRVKLMAFFVRCVNCQREVQLHYPARPAAKRAAKKPH